MGGPEFLVDRIHPVLADALVRFGYQGPGAYGGGEEDPVSAEQLDVTLWFEGRSSPATGRVLASSAARPRDELEHPPEPTIVVTAGTGVALVHRGAEFAYSVPHPRPAFFEDLLNRQVPQHDPPDRYFGWH